MTAMARSVLPENFGVDPHAGLVLDRCLPDWPENATEKGEAFAEFIAAACKLPAPPLYQKAYQRWRDLMAERQAAGCAALRCGRVDGRLFLGLGGASPLETAVTLHHSYGVPLLPGSALKGLARAYAASRIEPTHSEILFGREPGSAAEDSGEAGYAIFHDAWWIPDNAGNPLAPEIVTVHHPQYYASQGQTPAGDFDSPIPNAQVAVRGSFFFAVEALDGWADYAMAILWDALQYEGAGAKTAAGYGYFAEDEKQTKALEKALAETRNRHLHGADLLRAQWSSRKPDELAEALGKNANKTWKNLEENHPGLSQSDFAKLLGELHGETLTGWENQDKNTNNHKAFKRWKSWLGAV